MTQTIRILTFRDGDLFVAQALEVDVAAQGRTAEEALNRLGIALRAEALEATGEGRSVFDIGPAPAVMQALYEKSEVCRSQLDLRAA